MRSGEASLVQLVLALQNGQRFDAALDSLGLLGLQALEHSIRDAVRRVVAEPPEPPPPPAPHDAHTLLQLDSRYLDTERVDEHVYFQRLRPEVEPASYAGSLVMLTGHAQLFGAALLLGADRMAGHLAVECRGYLSGARAVPVDGVPR